MSLPVDELKWYVIHVRSRQEFVVSDELGRKGIEVFMPSISKLSQWKDRKKLVRFALFPGYLFVRMARHPEARLGILKTKGVVAFVCLENSIPTPVPSEEITALKSLVESGAEIDVFPHLKLGTRVKVIRGPLEGAEGILAKKENRTLFVVNIEILGRSAGVEISADDIEAC